MLQEKNLEIKLLRLYQMYAIGFKQHLLKMYNHQLLSFANTDDHDTETDEDTEHSRMYGTKRKRN